MGGKLGCCTGKLASVCASPAASGKLHFDFPSEYVLKNEKTKMEDIQVPQCEHHVLFWMPKKL